MQENGLDLRAIHPRNGEKYSPNLYQWLTNMAWVNRVNRVYRDAEGALFIGWFSEEHPDEFHGERLGDILCRGLTRGSWYWPNLNLEENLEEIPDFWQRYTAVGLCAIDEAHTMSFVGGENRWKQTGDMRVCQWCGTKQVLERWTETVEREAWRAAS